MFHSHRLTIYAENEALATAKSARAFRYVAKLQQQTKLQRNFCHSRDPRHKELERLLEPFQLAQICITDDNAREIGETIPTHICYKWQPSPFTTQDANADILLNTHCPPPHYFRRDNVTKGAESTSGAKIRSHTLVSILEGGVKRNKYSKTQ